jgi:hypothetical protein
MLISLHWRKRRSWPENKSNEEEVKSQPQTKVRDLPMTEHISLRTKMKNHTVTRKEEEVLEEDRVVEEVILEEEEEEEDK